MDLDGSALCRVRESGTVSYREEDISGNVRTDGYVIIVGESWKALKALVLDYDNLEVKQCLDAVGAWLLIDDGGLFRDVHHTTELGEADCTRMFIMDTDRFPAWPAERGMAAESMAGL